MLQSIPSDMEFDPNSNPPCYKTKEEVIHLSISLPVEYWMKWLRVLMIKRYRFNRQQDVDMQWPET